MTARDLHVEAVPPPPEGTVRHAVIDLLAALGIDAIFGNPGSTEMPLLRDLPDGLRYILGLQESVVLGMADGYAQARGNAAFVNLHSSAGLGHAMGNLVTAARNGTPLIVTAGQQSRSLLPHDPFLFAERPTELPQPFVKWACEPARAADVPAAILRAYQIAMLPPCGPTFVSIPIDDWDQPCPAPAVPRISGRGAPDPDGMARIAARLAGARRPVIVAGTGVCRDDSRAALAALADRIDAGIWIAPLAARNPVDEESTRFRGFLPASRERIVALLAGHDCILVVGAPAFTYHVEGAGPVVPEGATLLQLTADPREAARLPLGEAAVGDVARALAMLLDALPERAAAQPPAPIARPAPPADRLTDALLVARLHALRPRGIGIVEEAPTTRGPLHDLMPIGAGDEFHTCASGGLGHGLPAAIGVALGRDDGRPVLCLLGDGSAMYAIQGLWSAVAHGADVRFVIVNNGGYAALEQFGALFGIAPVGTRIDGIDFAAIARAQGMAADRVDDPAALDAAITWLFEGSGPRLLEVVVDRD